MMFQSLSRDSVCLDVHRRRTVPLHQLVSIPESGFCLFGQHIIEAPQVTVVHVSIPESGFCLFGLSSSVVLCHSHQPFQSLSRDSVCLD